jgi:hypothetical protein
MASGSRWVIRLKVAVLGVVHESLGMGVAKPAVWYSQCISEADSKWQQVGDRA